MRHDRQALLKAAPAQADASGAAFGNALMELSERLRRRAYRLTHDAGEAEDLLQETMAKAWSARSSFQAGSNLRAWTYTILRNLYLTGLRRSRHIADFDEYMADNLVETGADQHEKAELRAVLEAIDLLPTDQRSALCAVALEGLDYGSAADKLNVTQSALKSRIYRARAALVRMVEEGFSSPSIHKVATSEYAPVVASGCSATRDSGAWAAAKAAGKPLWIG